MLEYFTNQFGNKHRRVDIHSLVIDKKLAHEMPIAELWAALSKMGCPRIERGMARPDLLLRYGVWQQELVEAETQS
jgi:hypothetical protein